MNAAARPSIAAQRREETGKHVARLRRAGRLPAVVYGRGLESSNISLDAHEFDLFRKHTGSNTLIDVLVEGGSATPAIIHGVQIHPVTRRPLHVDLFAVRMTEELTVDVPIVTTGTSELVERDGGTIAHMDSVKMRALPDHLPHAIEVSVESLTSFDQVIRVGELPIPADAHLISDPDEVAVRILPPRVIEAEAPVATAEVVEAPAEETAES